MTEKILLYCSMFITLLLSFSLTGCYDNFDLEKRSLCTAIAADYSEDEGYSVILSVPVLENDEEIGRSLKSETGTSLSEAIEKIDAKSSKQLYFGHTQTVIMGMGLLRSEKALGQLTAYLDNNVQIDKNILLVGAYDIQNIMDLEPEEDKLTGFFISGYYDSGKDEKTFVNKETLFAYLKDTTEGKTAVIPVLAEEYGEPAFTSAAILKDGSLAGILNSREAMGYMWLSDKSSGGTLTCGEPPVSAEILEREAEYNFYEENGRLKLTVTIDAVGNMWNYTDDEIKSKGAEYLSAFRQEIKAQSEAALESLKEMDCDALALNQTLKKNFKDLYSRYGDSFDLSDTEVEVNLSLNFV
ncbi:MAG: hypothetical protein LUD81_06670 [Clostridiales bacterium]|nr:hypothetical protein [Clostridiales bacterium]